MDASGNAFETASGIVTFCSTVPAMYRAAVEQFFFFNPEQERLFARIEDAIARTGMPTIAEHNGRLRLDTPSHSLQCLFACHGCDHDHPVGVVLFGRPQPALIQITHLAVDPEWVLHPDHLGPPVACQLIEQVRLIAGSIRGVTSVQLPYLANCYASVGLHITPLQRRIRDTRDLQTPAKPQSGST